MMSRVLKLRVLYRLRDWYIGKTTSVSAEGRQGVSNAVIPVRATEDLATTEL